MISHRSMMMSNLVSVEKSLHAYKDSIRTDNSGDDGNLVFVDGSFYHNEPRSGRDE